MFEALSILKHQVTQRPAKTGHFRVDSIHSKVENVQLKPAPIGNGLSRRPTAQWMHSNSASKVEAAPVILDARETVIPGSSLTALAGATSSSKDAASVFAPWNGPEAPKSSRVKQQVQEIKRSYSSFWNLGFDLNFQKF